MFRENDYDFVYRRHMEEAVIDAVLKCMKNGGHMTYDEAMKIADTVPTQMKWIPCSERLPEEMGTYMTTIDYGEHGLVTGQRYYYGRGLKWNDECVIAWMPLPEPYKAESED